MTNVENKPIPPWVLSVDSVYTYAYYEDVFSDTECDDIIEYCRGLGLHDSRVGLNAVSNIQTRKSQIAFAPPTEFMIPYYQRLSAVILSMNTQFFNFDLYSFGEHLQFTQYEAPGDNYNYHIDRATGIPVRKLSLVVQLTHSDDYEGGDFELFVEEPSTKLSRKRGTVLVFPSYVVHRVTPVTKGIRNSLVGWINGKQFR